MPTPVYAERTPSEALRPWFLRVWGYKVGADNELLVPPDGCTSLLVVRHPDLPTHLSTSGPWFKAPAIVTHPGAQIWGFRIQPHATREVLGVDPGLLHDQRHSADRFFGALAHRVAAALNAAQTIDDAAAVLQDHFARIVPRLPQPDRVAAETVARINAHEGAIELEQLAQEMDRVGRTVSTKFIKATGMHPRDFAKLRRVFYAITGTLLQRPTWLSELGLTPAPSQLERVQEFLELTGRTPMEFLELAQRVEQDIVRV
jgi:methylphosphotriester-DNA--protein-cysteine methyltransferase